MLKADSIPVVEGGKKSRAGSKAILLGPPRLGDVRGFGVADAGSRKPGGDRLESAAERSGKRLKK